MSRPMITKTALIQSALCEIISGISSLHMHPDPLEVEEQEADNSGFISETDSNVRHSIEHFRAAVDALRNLNEPKAWVDAVLYEALRDQTLSDELYESLQRRMDHRFES